MVLLVKDVEEPKNFKDFIEYWKNEGYEVHVTKGFLDDLEYIERNEFSLWELPAIPFELAEDLLSLLPRIRFAVWLKSWMATLAIYANRPTFLKIRRRRQTSKSYRIA